MALPILFHEVNHKRLLRDEDPYTTVTRAKSIGIGHETLRRIVRACEVHDGFNGEGTLDGFRVRTLRTLLVWLANELGRDVTWDEVFPGIVGKSPRTLPPGTYVVQGSIVTEPQPIGPDRPTLGLKISRQEDEKTS